MESNKFFIFVNRFNSIAFMLVLLCSIASIVYFNVIANNWRENRSVTVSESLGSDKKVELVLGGIERIKGSQISFIELKDKNSKSSFSSGGGYGAVRNVLFFKNNSLKPSWLFEKNEYLIKNVIQLTTDKYSENADKNPALAVMYHVVYEDSDGNQKLDENDMVSVALSSTEGAGLKTIVSSVNSIIDHRVSEDGKFVDVIYQSSHKVYMERFSLESYKSISKSEITEIEKI